MAGIFLNYRRGPQSVAIGALAERLAHYFGADQVFIDHQMDPGTQYPEELRKRLLASDVVVAVIHDGWAAEFAQPRTKDWVLFELSTALAECKPVVPVLLEKVDPPQRHELPADIAEVAVLQAARVRGETFRADVDHLTRLLERHVAPTDVQPPEPAVAVKPKRVGRRVIRWATALFVLSPILFFYPTQSDWRLFAFPAFVSTVILAAGSLLMIIIMPVARKLSYRADVEVHTMSMREGMSRRWPLFALGALFIGYMASSGTEADRTLQDWEWFLLIATVLVGMYFVQRSWQRFSARDHTWPPPVSTEPAVFRRAAHRLHEKLTTDPSWRGSRSLANQREAETVYMGLAEVHLDLRTRATMSLAQWVKAGHSGEITGCLGLLASIVALDVVALALLTSADSATFRAYRFIALTVIAALVFTAATTVSEFYSDRREVTRWIHELTEWQIRLKPLVFHD